MLSFSTLHLKEDMYPISVYFGMFRQFQKTMTKIPFELTIHLPAEWLDKVSDVSDLNTKKMYFFVSTTTTNIP